MLVNPVAVPPGTLASHSLASTLPSTPGPTTSRSRLAGLPATPDADPVAAAATLRRSAPIAGNDAADMLATDGKAKRDSAAALQARRVALVTLTAREDDVLCGKKLELKGLKAERLVVTGRDCVFVPSACLISLH